MKTCPHESLGRYQIEAEIGRGAMGVVYRARDPKIDRLVALKTISLFRFETAEQQQYCERFLEEARAAGKLSHPGIVTIFDVGEHPATSEPYLVMEYVTGAPLSMLMSRRRRLPVALALQFATEVAEALGYAHSQGVIHRDIKPENILITEDGHAKVSDFGVARLKHAVTAGEGQLFGTPAYMSPEQLAGGLGDGRSDLFSLGVILYSMITGFRPFQGNTTESVCFKVINAQPVPASSFEAELPPELDRIIGRAMAKDPRERYRTGWEMADAIRRFVADDVRAGDASLPAEILVENAVIDRKTKQGARSGLRFAWQAGACAVVVACAMTVWQFNREYQQTADLQPPAIRLASAPAIGKALVPAARPHRPERRSDLAQGSRRSTASSSAKMRLEILHHFTSGKASLWLDHKLLFEQELRGGKRGHAIFHGVEVNQVASLQFAAGKHQLDIQVMAPENTYNQSQRVDLDFKGDREHLLVVNCEKRKLQVSVD